MYFLFFAVSGVRSFRILYAEESRRKTYIDNTVYSVELNSTRGIVFRRSQWNTLIIHPFQAFVNRLFEKKSNFFRFVEYAQKRRGMFWEIVHFHQNGARGLETK
jgi:hypothetical protein